MKFTTDKIQWTTAMKSCAMELATRKLARLVKDPQDMEVKITKINNDRVKITITKNQFRAQSVSSNYYSAVADAFSILKSILTKYKDKSLSYKHMDTKPILSEECSEAEDQLTDLITKEKVFNLSSTDLESAFTSLIATDYMFYVFKDKQDKDTISILYKRLDDTYGIIRCH